MATSECRKRYRAIVSLPAVKHPTRAATSSRMSAGRVRNGERSRASIREIKEHPDGRCASNAMARTRRSPNATGDLRGSVEQKRAKKDRNFCRGSEHAIDMHVTN